MTDESTGVRVAEVGWRVLFINGTAIELSEDVPWSKLINNVTNAGGGWLQVSDDLFINPSSIVLVERI